MTCKCNTCGHVLPIEDFHNTAKSKRCKPCTSKWHKERYNRCEVTRTGIKLRNRKKLVQRYGLTWEQFEAMWVEQDGKCKICAVPVDTFAPNSASTAACIDHCHDTQVVRGILCRSCNLGLGYFKDNPDFLTKAAAYVAPVLPGQIPS